jgi:uncharacterized repeat protein (TIGR03847 family)
VSPQSWDFASPDRCVIGTVGLPGERSFYLQVSQGSRLATLGMEKMQAALLADKLAELIAEVAGVDFTGVNPLVDSEPLVTPIEEDFAVGSMSLSWDVDRSRVILEFESAEVGVDATIDDQTPDFAAINVLRSSLTIDDAVGFVRRTRMVVAAGRPPCPLCAMPLDAEGHVCPRANGYRRRV